MKLDKFLNEHQNWEEILTQPPYSLTVKRKDKYILLKYNQFESDFTIDIVREARGSIFYFDEDEKQYICVCHPFDKFGNYGEKYVPELTWRSAIVTEKIDGSLIKVWYHGGWHVSTNGTINAADANISSGAMTYRELFDLAFVPYCDTATFFRALNPDYTYMFELVSPLNQMTIYYPETRLYLIGMRNTANHEEAYIHFSDLGNATFGAILKPRRYYLNNVENVLETVAAMQANQEGVVVQDIHCNRAKFKSEQYLIASHLRFNNIITIKKVVEMIRNNQLDDFLAYNTEKKDFVEKVLNAGRALVAQLNKEWAELSEIQFPSKREFYANVAGTPLRDYYLKKYDNKVPLTAREWLDKQPVSTIVGFIEQAIEDQIDNK